MDLGEVDVALGLADVLLALRFCHEDARLAHGNVADDTIFINTHGQWKLGGFHFFSAARWAGLAETVTHACDSAPFSAFEFGDDADPSPLRLAMHPSLDCAAPGPCPPQPTRMTRRRGGAGAITVPQYQMSYEPQGGPGTNPNNQIAINAQVSTQGAANSALDAGAFKMGGRRSRKRKGGNPDWVWGCMSGGRTKRSSRRRSSRKRSIRRKRCSRKRY